MKKRFVAIIALLCVCVLYLPACQISLLENIGGTGKTSESAENDPSVGGSKVRRDEDGLVTITIKDGKAQIEYDLEKWDASYNMADYIDGYSYLFDEYGENMEPKKGPFPVNTYDERVADACIGIISGDAYYGWYLEPTVIFLMEDGRLERSRASLAMDNSNEEHYSNPLYWLGDIVSLSYENDKDGQKTIYATGKNGAKYDTEVLNLMQGIVSSGVWGGWTAPLLENPPDGIEYYGYLTFENEEKAVFEIGVKEKQAVAGYRGSYALVLAEDDPSGYMAGSFTFDLELDWTEGSRSFLDGLTAGLKGSYFVELADPYAHSMWLRKNSGDSLFSLDGQKQDDYIFEMSYGEYEFYEPDEGEEGDGPKGISWTVEPAFSYEYVYYCPACDLFGPDGHGQTGDDAIDPKTGKLKPDKEIAKGGWGGHGIWTSHWLYDEANNLYGYLFESEGGDEYAMHTKSELLELHPWMADVLLAFRKIDSGKLKGEETDWGEIAYDLANAYQGDKYAFAYGLDFVTDFIYGYDIYGENDPADKVSVQLGGKWGVIDRNGETLLPFVFEHILFIDENTVFAKYEGKYGIITVAYG
ncbi:MAG: WG repeat-containing protein [Oscillospiraceae bacterium]|nr:WG repeat-containing protein [Oscillospiraceae bacterium]